MFRKIASLMLGAMIVAAPAVQAAPKLTPEAQLAKALEGRVAGEPVRCITNHQIRSSQVIEGVGILYKAGSTYYLNRPVSGADTLDRWDTMVTKIWGGQLCSNEVIRMVDPTSHMMTGLVFLGDFVPYRKAQP